MDVKDTPKQVKEIFQFLVQQDVPIVVAIDEFQQIGNYPGKNTDAWLRGLIQSLPNVRFIFAGSQQHILSSMFSEPGRPFFKSASPLKIEKIDQQAYAKFIEEKFADEGRSISPSIIYQMLDWTICHTYYVQLLCNRVFQTGKKFIEEQLWHQEANRILQEQEPFFFHYRGLLTIQQWKLLKAIALEKEVIEPTSKAFVSNYNLGSPSTVLRSLEALQSKELIYKEYKKNGIAFYGVYDVFFQRWMDRQV